MRAGEGALCVARTIEAEAGEKVTNRGRVTSALRRSGQRQELPDAVWIVRAPGTVSDQPELEETSEGTVEDVAPDPEDGAHPAAAVERRAV